MLDAIDRLLNAVNAHDVEATAKIASWLPPLALDAVPTHPPNA
ncbi:hypothetical protein [Nonomuraea mesophila]|nr:hypothetical protein [Nonomuraea mesophila]